MEYTISKFSKLLGVSVETLRHYERCGLLKPYINPSNEYRMYSDRDALQVWNIRMYRGMNMPIPEIENVMKPGAFEYEQKWLSEEISKLDRHILQLQMLRMRFTSRIENMTRAIQYTDEIEELDLPPAYHLYYRDFDEMPEVNAGEIMRRWMEGIPFIGFMFMLELSDVLSGGPLSPKLGLGARFRHIEDYALPIAPPVRLFTGGHGLRRRLRTRDPFSIGIEQLAPMLDYAKKINCTISANPVYMIEVIKQQQDGPIYYIDIHFQVKKI